MKNKILVILLTLFSLVATAQPLSLDECFRLAQENNKQIRSRQAQTKQATYTVKAQRANYLPDIALTGSGYWNNSKGTLLSIPETYLPCYDMMTGTPIQTSLAALFPGTTIGYEIGTIKRGGVSVTQPIYTGGKITSAYRMAQTVEKMSKLQETQTQQSVWIEVAEAYTLLVRAQEMQQVAKQHHALLDKLLHDVQSAVRHGMKIHNDELKVQVRLNESELAVHRADNARRLAAKNLCQLIGQSYDEDFAVEGTLPKFDGDRTYEAHLEDMLDCQNEMANQQMRLVRSEMLPQVGLQGNYNYMHGLKVDDATVLDGGSFSVVLNVSIPLYHFGGRSNKVKAAQAKMEQVELERQDLVEKMQLELSQATDNLDEARLEAELAVKSLSQAEENLQLSRKQYEAGMESISDLLEAQTLWQQAFAAKVETDCQQYLCGLRYMRAAGENLGLK